MNEIPTADFLKTLSNDGLKNYEQEVLEGPLFKQIISAIEDSALDGYIAWSRRVDSHDDIRTLRVIRKVLIEKGFYCEFETKVKNGLLGNYNEQRFVVRWGDESK